MNSIINKVQQDMDNLVQSWLKEDLLQSNDLFVVGCSTSEVIGETIGTSGSEAVAEIIFNELQGLVKEKQIFLAFQCCEHLNRALVLERKALEKYYLEEVTVEPVREAGGSMATYAYNHMENAVVVEHIQAHAGIDIGDTFIGMHLKHVAVPLRLPVSAVGNAHLTIAKTRPKLIGGIRAIYP